MNQSTNALFARILVLSIREKLMARLITQITQIVNV